MFRLAASILWITTATSALAAPKIALIRISEIYQNLESTKTMNEDILIERQRIQLDPRADAYRAVMAELKQVREKIGQTQQTSPEARHRLEVKYGLKRQEYLTLKREYEQFQEQRTREINRKLVEQTEQILTKIRHTATKTAAAQGFDLVLDADGKTNTGMPFVLYSKSPNDITSTVLKALHEAGVVTASDTSH